MSRRTTLVSGFPPVCARERLTTSLLAQAGTDRSRHIALPLAGRVVLQWVKKLERILKRNHTTLEEAVNRINSQMPVEEKASRADFIIDNNGSVEDTFRQVRELYVKLSSV